jgi:hypothetical protein
MAKKRKMRGISNGTLEKSGKSDVKAGRKGQLSRGIKPRKKYVAANFDVFPFVSYMLLHIFNTPFFFTCICNNNLSNSS